MSSISPLLKLPAEIRNQVWRYALPGQVTINRQQPAVQVPSICKVCRQTMKETLGLFTQETNVQIVVADCAGDFEKKTSSSTERLRDLAVSFELPVASAIFGSLVKYQLSGRRDWKNLKSWARAIHSCPLQHPLTGKEPIARGQQYINVIISVVCTAAKMRSLSWEQVDEILEHMHVAICAQDAGW